MKALRCNVVGSIDAAVVGDVPEPAPGPREALVRIHACGLNFPDVLMLQGKYQRKPPLPFTPGCEFSGIVESVGPDVAGFKPGDRVCGTVDYGALAQKLAVSADNLVLLPPSVDMDQAAALLYTYGTSLYALRERGALAAGNSLLVLGAGGGVGVAAVELGKALGARVVAAASSESKLDLARSKGADLALRYPLDMRDKQHQREFADRLKEASGANGFDVICDPIGGDYAEPALRSIAWQGRYVVVGFAAGAIPRIPLNLPLLKGCQIVGSVWGTATARDPQLRLQLRKELIDLFAQGRIRPHIHCKFDLAQAQAGLKVLAERRAVGKVIVVC
jgi:NADPH2:quinone reductase